MEEKKVKVIAVNRIARELIKLGHNLVDIKPHKDDHRRTVFIFELTPQLEEYLSSKEV